MSTTEGFMVPDGKYLGNVGVRRRRKSFEEVEDLEQRTSRCRSIGEAAMLRGGTQ